MQRIKEIAAVSLSGLLCSYAQVFFSVNKLFGALLLLVTFFDPGAGAAGVLAVLTVQLIAWFFNFNIAQIKDGTFTYNALMVGLALGVFYEFNYSLIHIQVAVSILTFLFTLWFMYILGQWKLPFLSLPFVLGVWVVILGASNFSALELSQKEILYLQELTPELFTNTTDLIARLPFHNVIYLYLRSMGAIFFQFTDLAGIIVVIGILYYSRMAFLLSVFGFLIGYAFYHFQEGDFSQLIYTYIGFNFILTAIALGGFFVVPSRKSFGQLFLIIPAISLLISAMHSFFSYFELPLYSLPFNVMVLFVLAGMMYRTRTEGLSLVSLQQYSPEKHHYSFYHNLERFSRDTYIHIALPFMGEWYLSQGYNGDITHKEDWRFALDFDVRDENGSTYRMPGYDKEDYYCYNLPVLSPAPGEVVEVLDGIPDNEIGKVNLEQNWGNTIVIKHSEFLYSHLSHIKSGSFTVKKGDYVKKGEVIARCGNSGRSPEPHLHFQMQTTPYIGSTTISYPISYYVSQINGDVVFHAFEVPKEGEVVSNMRTSKVLTNTFEFIPGKKFNAVELGTQRKETWEVYTTATNQTYIWCPETKSTAWIANDQNVFYFLSFTGSTNSLLYQFFLGAYKVPLGYYRQMSLTDNMNIMNVVNPLVRAVHDFTAPFFHYLNAQYQFQFDEADNDHEPYQVKFSTNYCIKLFGREIQGSSFRFDVDENKLLFTIENKRSIKTIQCTVIS